VLDSPLAILLGSFSEGSSLTPLVGDGVGTLQQLSARLWVSRGGGDCPKIDKFKLLGKDLSQKLTGWGQCALVLASDCFHMFWRKYLQDSYRDIMAKHQNSVVTGSASKVKDPVNIALLCLAGPLVPVFALWQHR
jgi:hypothetical protein